MFRVLGMYNFEVHISFLNKYTRGLYISHLITLFLFQSTYVDNRKDLSFFKNIFFQDEISIELVSKEFNHLAAILHVYAGGLNFMK